MAAELGWKKKLLFTAIVAGLVLVCVEAMLQVYYYASAGEFLFRRTTAPIFAPDEARCYALLPDLEYTHRTNEFTTRIYTNARGLRTDARREVVPYEKPADVYRVMFLGPSFTFGWGNEWEDTYPAILAERLRVPGKRVELVNVGTPAQGPGPQLCWFRDVGHRYDPDLVVQTSYGSEVAPVLGRCPDRIECPYIEGGRLYGAHPTPWKRLLALVKNSGVVFYGYYAWNALAPAPEADGRGDVGKELWSDEARADVDAAEVARQYERFVRFVREINGEDTQVAFLHIPLSFVVHEEDLPRWRHITDVTPAQARATVAAGLEALERSGIAMVDTTDALIAHADEERLYYWLDIHLTPAGNRVVADAVLPTLQRLATGGVTVGAH